MREVTKRQKFYPPRSAEAEHPSLLRKEGEMQIKKRVGRCPELNNEGRCPLAIV